MENGRVLIVEDDRATRVLVQAVLEHFGYACDPCSDGHDAVRMLRGACYDAIVLDLMLPGQFGFDVLRHLHAERPALAQRVVVTTAAPPALLRHFDHSQVRAVLYKPLDIAVLLEHVEACAAAAAM